MHERFDVAALNASTDLVALIQRSVELRRDGKHFRGRCPFHKESTASFTVTPSKNLWKCFGCGESGHGAVDWIIKFEGLSFLDACKSLTSGDLPKVDPKANYYPKEKPLPEIVIPIPDKAFEKKPAHRKYGIPNDEWTYRDVEGRPIAFVQRFNRLNSDGSPDTNDAGKQRKEIIPLIYTKSGWRWKAPPAPRPLYGLDRIKSGPVAIFEGEKCADWAAPLMDNTAAIAWMGGTGAIEYTDWSVLDGKQVALCPDNDYGGFKAMKWLGQYLSGRGCRVFWIAPPAGSPKGWDAADSNWTAAELLAWFRTGIPFSKVGENPHPAPDVAPGKSLPPKPPEMVAPTITPLPGAPPVDPDAPFTHLGYERTGAGGRVYWYYNKAQQMTLCLTPGGMSESGLLQLAPLSFWEIGFVSKSGKFDKTAATNMLIQRGTEVGLFDPKRIRGRGAWRDAGRMVIHCGSHLIVDGKTTSLGIESKYVYEQRQRINLQTGRPFKKKEAAKYLDLCKAMNWDAPVMAYLLAGWVTIAPLCGILPWRPHLWIVGSAQVGKSTIMDHLVSRMLGEMKIAAQGLGTTEAGLRQALNSDALPVAFDEVDVDGRRSREALENIIQLIRSMSTGSGAGVIKGSGTGVTTVFELRSMFVLSSIAFGAEKTADRTRISLLSLHKSRDPDAARKWQDEIKPRIENTITDEFVMGFQSRALSMAPVILENSKTFCSAVSDVLKNQRLGDQLGPLLAGAYSIVSDGLIDIVKAREWVESHGWSAERDVIGQRDENLCLAYILDQIMRFPVNGASTERTVTELIFQALWPAEGQIPDMQTADETLRRHGLRVDEEHLYIANKSPWIAQIMRDKPWSANTNEWLSRVDGAERTEAMKFAGRTARAVKIPLESCGISTPEERITHRTYDAPDYEGDGRLPF